MSDLWDPSTDGVSAIIRTSVPLKLFVDIGPMSLGLDVSVFSFLETGSHHVSQVLG